MGSGYPRGPFARPQRGGYASRVTTIDEEGDEPRVAAERPAREGYDVGRLLAFSDGVFAIAITLLVLSIPIPSVPPDQVGAALQGLWPNLVGFGLSFILVGAQWISHHRMLRQLTSVDSRLLWLNLLLLLGICLVPFGTGILIRYGQTAVGAIVYSTLQGGIVLTYLVMRAFLLSRGAGTRASLLVSLIPFLGFTVSIPVALVNVKVAYALWVGGFLLARTIEARISPGPWRRSQS
jgi:uncharacterized membrane protein